jgi:hypothetical protein
MNAAEFERALREKNELRKRAGLPLYNVADGFRAMDVTERTLKAVIERQHRVTAHLAYIDALPTTFHAGPVRDGIVFVFDLEGHPGAKRAYGWTSLVGQNGERQFHVALQVPPIASARDVIRMLSHTASISSTSARMRQSRP